MNIKQLNELYREWSGRAHTEDIEHNIYDSAQMQEFADYCAIAMLAEARAEIEQYKMGKVAPADYYSMKEAEAELCDEIAALRAEIEHLKQELRDCSTLAARQIVPAEMLVDELRAEIERKDALIEQMRDALKLADDLIDEYAADYEHRDNVDELRDMIKAALSAAERGE